MGMRNFRFTRFTFLILMTKPKKGGGTYEEDIVAR